MPFLGAIIPAKAVQVDADRRRIERDRDAGRRALAAEAAKRGADEAELTMPAVTESEPVRAVAENGSEDAHEDREAHGAYDARGGTEPSVPRIDVEG